MTAQFHENLILNGEVRTIAGHFRIQKHPRIIQLKKEEIDYETVAFSTACWRGYIGSWEIKDNKLYLIGIIGIYKLLGDEPLFADWFSDTLDIPNGEMIEYIHMGFASEYSSMLHIKIKKGMVIKEWTSNGRNYE